MTNDEDRSPRHVAPVAAPAEAQITQQELEVGYIDENEDGPVNISDNLGKWFK